MRLYDFVRLDTDARMECVNENGSLVTNDPKTRSNFYMVNDFYVEVRLNDGADRIIAVMPFKTGKRYDRMLERINLARLG